jgi:hypothetical protein
MIALIKKIIGDKKRNLQNKKEIRIFFIIFSKMELAKNIYSRFFFIKVFVCMFPKFM